MCVCLVNMNKKFYSFISELIIYTRVNRCIWKTKEKNQSKGISGVLAKNPPKVKSEESSNNAREYEL